MNIFRKFFALLRLREAVRKADQAWAITRRRHFVLPGAGRSLVVMDRANFRALRRKGYIPGHPFVPDALRESFYFTPDAAGSAPISEADRRRKILQYLAWFQSRAKSKTQNPKL